MISARPPHPATIRDPLTDDIVERIRRERYAPSVTQGDYLHLEDLRRALTRTFASLELPHGPALDVFCGTQPYREMIPSRPVWGFDIDRHFGRADVVGRGTSLPFADDTFALVISTQALHIADDPLTTVREMRRVLTPGGAAVVTVPYALHLESTNDRRLTREDLATLFCDWDLTIGTLAGLGVGLAEFPGTLLRRAVRRWPALRPLTDRPHS